MTPQELNNTLVILVSIGTGISLAQTICNIIGACDKVQIDELDVLNIGFGLVKSTVLVVAAFGLAKVLLQAT